MHQPNTYANILFFNLDRDNRVNAASPMVANAAIPVSDYFDTAQPHSKRGLFVENTEVLSERDYAFEGEIISLI